MRVIIKPVGLFCIIGAFAILIVVAFFHNKTTLPVVTTDNRTSVATPAASSAAASLPPGVLLMPDIASNEWKLLTGKGRSTESIIDCSVAYHPRARHIDILALGDKPWDIQVKHALNVALKKDKRIRLTFWARSNDSCPITAVVEQNADPYTKVIYKIETLSPSWQQFTEEWTQAADTSDQWAQIDFQLSHKVGSIELTGVTIHEVD